MQKGSFTLLPFIGLRDMLILPYTTKPFLVGRKSSVLAIESAHSIQSKGFLVYKRSFNRKSEGRRPL